VETIKDTPWWLIVTVVLLIVGFVIYKSGFRINLSALVDLAEEKIEGVWKRLTRSTILSEVRANPSLVIQAGIAATAVLFFAFYLNPLGRGWDFISETAKEVTPTRVLILLGAILAMIAIIFLVKRFAKRDSGSKNALVKRTDTDATRVTLMRKNDDNKGKIWPVIGIIAGLALANFLLYAFFPSEYMTWATTMKFWAVMLALLVVLTFLYFSDKNGKRAGKYIVYLTLASFAFMAFRSYEKDKVPKITSSKTAEKTPMRELRGGERRFTVAPWVAICKLGGGNTAILEAVQEAFPDDTTMWNIAAAESGCIHYEGSLAVQNREGAEAYGVFQIHVPSHGTDCGGHEEINIHHLEGNIACAKILRARNGYQDWKSSEKVWGQWIVPFGDAQPSTSLAVTDLSPAPFGDDRFRPGDEIDFKTGVTPGFVADSVITLAPGEKSHAYRPGRWGFYFYPIEKGVQVYGIGQEMGSRELYNFWFGRECFRLDRYYTAFWFENHSSETVRVHLGWAHKSTQPLTKCVD
jgi:hypothetical protein